MLLATVLGALMPVLTASGATVSEGDTATILVRLSRTSRRPVTVRFQTMPGSAQPDADYAAQSGTLTFRPGRRVLRIRIATNDDSEAEPEETLAVVFTRVAGARLGTRRAAVRIRRSDLPATFVLRADMSGAEEPANFAHPTGRGSAVVTFDPEGEKITYDVRIDAMEPTLAGICRGAPFELGTDVRQFEGRFVGGRMTGSVQLGLTSILEIYRTPERFCARSVDSSNQFIRGYFRRA